MKLTVSDYQVIPEGIYDARLASIEQKHDDSSDRDFLVWHFEARGKSGKTADVTGASSLSFGPKSKAYAWATALLGRKLLAREEVDTDDLRDHACKLVVKLENGDDGMQRNKISDVLAPEADPDEAPF